MTILVLELPKLTVSLSVPDELAGDFKEELIHSLSSQHPQPADVHYAVRFDQEGLALYKERARLDIFPSVFELIFKLEEEIENALVKSIEDWVAFHAGCVAVNDSAIMVVGHPDTGKTTSTFQLLEMGCEFLCEEVTPVDPVTNLVYPFPQTLTFSRAYAEESGALFPVREGILSYYGPELTRYVPSRVRKKPTRLEMILFPSYDPECSPKIEEVTPGDVLTELLSYCFPPNIRREELYDNVIRISENCRLLRFQTNGIASTRDLLAKTAAAF